MIKGLADSFIISGTWFKEISFGYLELNSH